MTLVRANDARIDRLDRLTDAHDEQLRDISRTGDRRSSDRRAIYLMLAAILITQIAELAARHL